jgi:BASS family bile acid:Na+ symporter
MIRAQDLILLAVSFSSIALAVLFPRFGSFFSAAPLYCMMALVFLSFLSIPVKSIWQVAHRSRLLIGFLLLIKLILLPVSVYFLFHWLFPTHALAALLVSGISPGVVTPFFSEILVANTSLVTVGMFTGSLLVPLTLPALVKILAGHSIHLRFVTMANILAMVVFIPFVLAEIVKRLSPWLSARLIAERYSLSLLLFAMTNFAVFSKYSVYLRQQPSMLLIALVMAAVLAAIFFAVGVAFSWNLALPEQLAIIISLSQVNNILVLVFSSHLFGPIEPMVAAMYSVPFFALLVPLRGYQRWRLKTRDDVSRSQSPPIDATISTPQQTQKRHLLGRPDERRP